MKISEVMTSNVITAGPEANLSEIARLMAENGVSGVPIVDTENKVLGIVTERDFLPQLKGVPFSNVKLPTLFGEWFEERDFGQLIAEARKQKATDVMKSPVVTVDVNDELGRAAELLAQHSVKRLPVVQDGVLVGIINRADIIRAIASSDSS